MCVIQCNTGKCYRPEGVFFSALADPSREIYREGLCGGVFVPSLADPSQDVGGSVCVCVLTSRPL